MTMLLILDAVEDGRIKLEDEVTVSEYAASMGGSQVFRTWRSDQMGRYDAKVHCSRKCE